MPGHTAAWTAVTSPAYACFKISGLGRPISITDISYLYGVRCRPERVQVCPCRQGSGESGLRVLQQVPVRRIVNTSCKVHNYRETLWDRIANHVYLNHAVSLMEVGEPRSIAVHGLSRSILYRAKERWDKVKTVVNASSGINRLTRHAQLGSRYPTG